LVDQAAEVEEVSISVEKKKVKNIKMFKFSVIDVINIFVIVYLMLPIVIILLFSFNAKSAAMFPMAGLTIKWYKKVLTDYKFISALKNSIYVGLAVAAVSVVIGSLASVAMIRYNFKLKNFVRVSVLVPITLPPVVLGVALLSFFSSLGFTRSLLTVIISHVLFCTPFVIMIMNSRLEGFDISLEEAAMDLGASRAQTFRYVTFPLIRPSIIGASMLTFGLSFDEFLVTFFIVGKQNTLPIVIWGMLRRGVSPVINAIATMVLIISMTLIIVANRYAKIRTLG
jgi:spermidine/putrescine transport system permease protein